MAAAYDHLMRLLLIGDSGSGKSSLLLRFTDDTFTTFFTATIGIDFKIRTVEIDGARIKVQLWDTAGQERFRTITTAYYRGSMGIGLIYDVSYDPSFQNVRYWMRSIREHSTTDVDIVLIGNKSDIDRRAVDSARGKALADEYGIPFIETSAKENINVEEAFMSLIRMVKHRLFNHTERPAKTGESMKVGGSSSLTKTTCC